MTAPFPIGRPWGLGAGGGSLPPVQSPITDAEQATGVPMTRTLQLPLPEIAPIPSALQFNPIAQAGTAAVQASVDIGLLQSVAQGNLGVVNSVTLYILNMLDTTNVTWTLFFNGNAVPGFTALSIFPRIAPYVSNSFDALYRVQGPGNFTVSFSNNDGGTYTVGAAISGWQWPIAMDKVWKANGGATG